MSLPHPSQGNRKTLEQIPTCRYDWPRAKVAELADAQDSGSCGLNTRGGSSPPFRTSQLCELPQGRQSSVLGLRSSSGLSCLDVVPYFCPSRRSAATLVGVVPRFRVR